MKKINISFLFFISAVFSLGIFTSIAWQVGNANTEPGTGWFKVYREPTNSKWTFNFFITKY